jgi:hypothetical protein
MPLYTVSIEFADRTCAFEQVEATTPDDALRVACGRSQALSGRFDREAISAMTKHHLKMFQVAGMLGVWNWHPVPGYDGITAEIFGGVVIQTDSNAPARPKSI